MASGRQFSVKSKARRADAALQQKIPVIVLVGVGIGGGADGFRQAIFGKIL